MIIKYYGKGQNETDAEFALRILNNSNTCGGIQEVAEDCGLQNISRNFVYWSPTTLYAL